MEFQSLVVSPSAGYSILLCNYEVPLVCLCYYEVPLVMLCYYELPLVLFAATISTPFMCFKILP